MTRRFFLADVLAAGTAFGAVWALQVFRPSVRQPKYGGAYRRYPAFIRLAFVWLIAGALLGVWADIEP